MILGQVSWLDCFVFLVFLAPQLIVHVGFFQTALCGLKALPFLVVKLPLAFVYERLFLNLNQRTPFVQQASLFEDLVIRCVRYAFAYIPANIGRVFFSKLVSLPFLYFRLLRHGYFRCPIHWHEIKRDDFTGIWMIDDPTKTPDIIIYYAHGGGFSMGSSYFYLEFLLTYLHLLKSNTSFKNPAILALEYTLVPDSSYPMQLQECISGYKYLLSIQTMTSQKIVLSGDSAGGTIMLSLLLWLGGQKDPQKLKDESKTLNKIQNGSNETLGLPGFSILISPWTTLISPLHQDTMSDYLSTQVLHEYAQQYSNSHSPHNPLISPGENKDMAWWKESTPKHGFYFIFGAEEVFGEDIRGLVSFLRRGWVEVGVREEEGGIHAWVVASLFLSGEREKKLKGLRGIVEVIGGKMDGGIGAEVERGRQSVRKERKG